jgi:hypothetical protein
MVEGPSGVAVSALRHTMGPEFYLLAFARNAPHGTNRGLGRECSGAVSGDRCRETYKRVQCRQSKAQKIRTHPLLRSSCVLFVADNKRWRDAASTE